MRSLALLLTLMLTGAGSLAVPATAAPVAAAQALPPLRLQFEADERHYTVLAWLNWIGDRDPREAKEPRHEAEKQLMNHLAAQKLPEEMRQRHRKAYDAYLPGSSLYVKNGLLISASLAYTQPPAFAIQSLQTLGKADREHMEERIDHLPPAALMAEFHARAHLHELWQKQHQQAHLKALEYYRPRAEKLLNEAYRQLKVPISVPISFRYNLLGNYGILGQTSYSPWEKRYLIKLHFNPLKAGAEKWEQAYEDLENLRVMRHEMTHALLNDAVRRHQHLLAPKLASMGKALKLNWLQSQAETTAPEWIAQCVGYLDLDAELHENVNFYNRNPLYMHFMEKWPAFLASGQRFDAYLPELFKSFDADKEVKRWREIVARKKAAGEL